MLKACLLAFLSGIFFFFLILQSAWWLLPGVLTWTAIFVWQDHQERQRDQARELDADPKKQDRP
jgi:4-hydroxybenzoate polyprenyltransferase